ncbi:MAG: cation transporter [Bacteroidetes bacterium]|nr:cation transporter [Bacteroidota bacterium]
MFTDDILKTRKEIKRFFIAGFWTLLLETLLCLYIAYISNSVIIFTFMLQNSLSLIVYFFAIIALDLSIKDNSYKFPYGTGRLENFISFFQAGLSLPGAGIVLYSIWKTSVNAPPTISFGYTQIAFLYINLRLVMLKWWANSIMKRSDAYSPILKAYNVYYTICLIETILSAVSLLVALYLQHSHMVLQARIIDILLSVIVATYWIVNSLKVMKENFEALIDLPLKEADQLMIMKTLAEQFNQYEGIGYIYSRTSGRQKIIEIELNFSKNRNLSEIADLQEAMKNRLAQHFSDVKFNLIPVIK